MADLIIDIESLQVDENLFKDIKYYVTGQVNDKVYELSLKTKYIVLINDFFVDFRATASGRWGTDVLFFRLRYTFDLRNRT